MSEPLGQVPCLDGLSGGEPGKQPRRVRIGASVHVAALGDEFRDEQGETFGEGQTRGADMEPQFVVSLFEVADGEGADAGDRLGEEQDKQSGHPVAQFDGVVVEETAQRGDQLGPGERRCGRPSVVGNLEARAVAVGDGPDEKAAGGPASGGRCGEPVVHVALLAVGERTSSCVEPAQEVHRRVGLLAGLAGG